MIYTTCPIQRKEERGINFSRHSNEKKVKCELKSHLNADLCHLKESITVWLKDTPYHIHIWANYGEKLKIVIGQTGAGMVPNNMHHLSHPQDGGKGNHLFQTQ